MGLTDAQYSGQCSNRWSSSWSRPSPPVEAAVVADQSSAPQSAGAGPRTAWIRQSAGRHGPCSAAMRNTPAASAVATPPLTRIIWQTPVDLQPQYFSNGQYLLTHYGSPVISSMNTVLVPVKVGAQVNISRRSAQRLQRRPDVECGQRLRRASAQLVSQFQLTITANGRGYAPGSGGKARCIRDNVDSATGTVQTAVFYGANVTTRRAPSWILPSGSARRSRSDAGW